MSDTAALANTFLGKNEEKLKMNQYWYSAATLQAMVDVIVDCLDLNSPNNTAKIAFLSTPSVYFSLPEALRNKHGVLMDYDDQWSNTPGFFKYDFHKPEDIPDTLHGTFDLVVIDPPFITEEVWAQYAVASKLLLKSDSSNSSSDKPSTTAPRTEDGEQKGVDDIQQLGGKSNVAEIDFDNIDPFKSNTKMQNSPRNGEEKQTYQMPGGKRDGPVASKFPPITEAPVGKVFLSTIGEHEAFLHEELLGVTCRQFRPSIPNLIYQYSFFANFPSPVMEKLNPEIDN